MIRVTDEQKDCLFLDVHSRYQGMGIEVVAVKPEYVHWYAQVVTPKYAIGDIIINKKNPKRQLPCKIKYYKLESGRIVYVDFDKDELPEEFFRLATKPEVKRNEQMITGYIPPSEDRVVKMHPKAGKQVMKTFQVEFESQKKKKTKRKLKSHPLERKSVQKKLSKVIKNVHDKSEDDVTAYTKAYSHDKPKNKRDHILDFLDKTPVKNYAMAEVPYAAAHHKYRSTQLYPKVSLKYFEKIFNENIKITRAKS